MSDITLLAIETSCDETGVAVVQKQGDTITTLGEAVASQIDIHATTGGVVPEVAAREHVQVLKPLIEKVMKEAAVTKEDISGIAVTVGPGLMPALAVGVMAAKTLAYTWKKPIVPVHHIEGHIYSALLEAKQENPFPALAVIVSGGHTMFVHMKNHLSYEIIGATLDDAAGEAFDKVARLLSLPYPGGPHLSKLAKEGSPTAFSFPRPMLKKPNFDVSFSGLKTAVLYTWRGLSPADQEAKKADIAASFEEAVVDVLAGKTAKVIEAKKPNLVIVAGGVAANIKLRERLFQTAERYAVPFISAPASLYGDNAVMIGQAGTFAYEAGRKKGWEDIEPIARIPITEFSR